VSEPRVAILVPRREGFALRDRTWAWVKAWWQRELPEYPVVEGHHTEGLFNRSAALNLAARLAGEWDVALIIDADIICDPGRVRAAVAQSSEIGSNRIMAGEPAHWERFVARRYYDQHSSVIAVPRTVWDTVGGFDETFRGWGMEDTAFACAVTTLVGPLVHMPGECWHFYHPSAPEGHIRTPSANANRARGARYQAALGNADAMRELLRESSAPVVSDEQGIPRIFHRVVPEHTSPEVEAWWQQFQALHPNWRFMTHRDPLDPAEWPETRRAWRYCKSGASLADLVRLEALWRWGGIYVDSDVVPWQSFESLLPLYAFAAWEDANTVPNAVMGARRAHPAIQLCIALACREVRRSTWAGGPGVTTKVLVGRPDVLLLPPGAFYPVHYRDPERAAKMDSPDTRRGNPWAFGLHRYAGSWLK
jgi:hypothetical protein